MSDGDATTFYIPSFAEDDLSVLGNIEMHPFPDEDEGVTRPDSLVKAPESRPERWFATIDGRVCCSEYDASACLVFVETTKVRHMPDFRALHQIGVLPDDEMAYLEGLQESVEKYGRKLDTVESAIQTFRAFRAPDDLEPPAELLEMRDEIRRNHQRETRWVDASDDGVRS